jgi:hypothetical protein
MTKIEVGKTYKFDVECGIDYVIVKQKYHTKSVFLNSTVYKRTCSLREFCLSTDKTVIGKVQKIFHHPLCVEIILIEDSIQSY